MFRLCSHLYCIVLCAVCVQYQKSMEASANTSQPLIGSQEVLLIFSCVPELRRIHREFLRLLRERIVPPTADSPSPAQTLNDTPIADAYAVFVCFLSTPDVYVLRSVLFTFEYSMNFDLV